MVHKYIFFIFAFQKYVSMKACKIKKENQSVVEKQQNQENRATREQICSRKVYFLFKMMSFLILIFSYFGKFYLKQHERPDPFVITFSIKVAPIKKIFGNPAGDYTVVRRGVLKRNQPCQQNSKAAKQRLGKKIFCHSQKINIAKKSKIYYTKTL